MTHLKTYIRIARTRPGDTQQYISHVHPIKHSFDILKSYILCDVLVDVPPPVVRVRRR